MIEPFLGTWKLVSSKNIEVFMSELGGNFPSRNVTDLVNPNVNISLNGEKVNIQTGGSFENNQTSFKLGEEFDEIFGDNHKVKTTVTIEGDMMVQVQKWQDKEATIKRKIVEGKMVEEYTVNNIVGTKTYEKV